MIPPVALVCIALLGALPFVLGFSVSIARVRSARPSGYSGDPADGLYKIVRAHGNTAEYAPMLALLIYLVALRDPAAWAIWLMCVATVCRYLIVGGILLSPTLNRAHPLRFVGALGTYVAGAGLSVALLLTL